MEGAVRFQLLLSLLQLLLGISNLQLRLFSLNPGYNLLLAGLEFVRFHLVPRLHHGGGVLFFREACLGTSLLDLRLCGFKAGPGLCEFLLRLRFVELNHHVARFYRRTLGQDLDNPEVACFGGRADGDRLQRLHLASKLKRVKEFFPFHFQRRQRWGSPAVADRRPQHHSAARHHQNGDDQHPALPPKLVKAFNHHDPLPVSVCPDTSTSTAADRSGINLGLFPWIDTMTTNERSLAEKLPPSPMGASCSILAGNTSSGYASSRTFAVWPMRKLRKSC